MFAEPGGRPAILHRYYSSSLTALDCYYSALRVITIFVFIGTCPAEGQDSIRTVPGMLPKLPENIIFQTSTNAISPLS